MILWITISVAASLAPLGVTNRFFEGTVWGRGYVLREPTEVEERIPV
jgi:hypothetical protein